MKIKHILLDMDGVLVQWLPAVCDLFDITLSQLLEAEKPASYEMYAAILKAARKARPDEFAEEYWNAKTMKEEVWDRIEDAGISWWASLEEHTWALQLLGFCAVTAPTYICTAPSPAPMCASGKLIWMREFFDEGFEEFLITKRKHLLATPGVVLIDDADWQCDAFWKAGGTAILFPQPWNSLSGYEGNKLNYIKKKLEEIQRG